MITSVAIHKGGSGKTTSTVNIGAGLAKLGHKTLVVDLDPQGNLSLSLGYPYPEEQNIYGALLGQYSLPQFPVKNNPNLFICPADISLAESEFSLAARARREYLFQKAIKPVRSNYDFILIDCPPSVGILTLNALAASDNVLIPIESHVLPTAGFRKMLEFIRYVQSEINEDLKLRGVFLTKHDPRTKMDRTAKKAILDVLDNKAMLFDNYVRKNVRLAEAPGFGMPIYDYDPECAGSIDYMNITKEFIEK